MRVLKSLGSSWIFGLARWQTSPSNDYRQVNTQIIPDEYPLPKMMDYLHSLYGAEWLSIFDALAGFTQLELDDAIKEITAFRTHRGLLEFNRLPFGLKIGPSVFQRVTQGILANFLWIFALC